MTAEVGPPPPDRGDREPLQRHSTSETNRNRVQENQRILAAQLMSYSMPVLACLAILMILLLFTGLVIYVKGWVVMLHSDRKSCDMPLKWWLLVMLLVPIVQLQLNGRGEQSEGDQCPRPCQALVTPLGIAVGAVMYMQSRTCAHTNPELFQYTRIYLIYQFVLWLMMIFMTCGLVSVVFWLHRNGLLEGGPGPASAGRTGLINEIESVPFCPDQCSNSPDDELEPPECPICQEEFVPNNTIKKTPCGHLFHEQCLGEWLENYGKICPLCRKDLEEAVEQHGCGA